MIGYALTLALLFPLFWLIGSVANPARADAQEAAPITVVAKGCEFNPFLEKQRTPCGRTLGELTRLGVQYERRNVASDVPVLQIGERTVTVENTAIIQPALEAAGYDFSRQTPTLTRALIIMAALLGLSALSGATYGPVAALLSEYFPPRIRYSSMSIPYHFGTGYFGGFLPLVSQYIAARTGDVYAGLWYTMAVVFVALLVCFWGLKETRPDPVRESAAT